MAQWQISRALVWEVKVPDVIKHKHFTWWPWMQSLVYVARTWTPNSVLSIHTSPGPAATCLCLNHKEFPSVFIRKEVHQSMEGSSMLVLRACGWALQDAQTEGPEPNHCTTWVLCQPSDYTRDKNTKQPPEEQNLTAGFLIAKGWALTTSEKTHTPWSNDGTQSAGARVPRMPS